MERSWTDPRNIAASGLISGTNSSAIVEQHAAAGSPDALSMPFQNSFPTYLCGAMRVEGAPRVVRRAARGCSFTRKRTGAGKRQKAKGAGKRQKAQGKRREGKGKCKRKRRSRPSCSATLLTRALFFRREENDTKKAQQQRTHWSPMQIARRVACRRAVPQAAPQGRA